MKNGEKFRTAKEQTNAFLRFCRERNCSDCYIGAALDKAHNSADCLACWLASDVREEKPLPCPFCGRDTQTSFAGGDHWSVECFCGYRSGTFGGEGCAILHHNRVVLEMKSRKERK